MCSRWVGCKWIVARFRKSTSKSIIESTETSAIVVKCGCEFVRFEFIIWCSVAESIRFVIEGILSRFLELKTVQNPVGQKKKKTRVSRVPNVLFSLQTLFSRLENLVRFWVQSTTLGWDHLLQWPLYTCPMRRSFVFGFLPIATPMLWSIGNRMKGEFSLKFAESPEKKKSDLQYHLPGIFAIGCLVTSETVFRANAYFLHTLFPVWTLRLWVFAIHLSSNRVRFLVHEWFLLVFDIVRGFSKPFSEWNKHDIEYKMDRRLTNAAPNFYVNVLINWFDYIYVWRTNLVSCFCDIIIG